MGTERKCSQSALEAKEEGNTLFSSGDYEAAIIKYKKAISIDPSNPAFYTNICNCCKKLGKFEEMERYARLCVEIDKTFMKGHYNLAMSFLSRKMERDVLKICEDALKIDSNQKDIKKLYDETKKKLDDEALTDLMKQLKVPNGKSVWVSKNLANHKSEFMSPEGSIDLNKILESDSTRRGICANPDCRADEKSLGTKMMRCSRCWQVDYCNRDCQKADWKRHKKQCTKSGGWQSLIYEGKQAMKKKDFTRAIELFLKVLDTKKEITASLTIISECFLENGDASNALNYAFQSCQSAYADLMSLVIKARCHEKMNDIEAAYLTCYSAYNSHICMSGVEGSTEVENNHLVPMYKDLTQKLIEHISRRKKNLTPSCFPMKVKISSVPFTINFRNGQVAIMQNELGTGFHDCRPQRKCSNFPGMQEHSAITYGSSIIIFGGLHASGQLSNQVHIFQIDTGNNYSHHVQPCDGEAPPPSQGHSACIVSHSMYVFGGSAMLEDLYILDLKLWKWEKMNSISKTPLQDRPETDVLFSELVKFDDESILLLGGLRGEVSRSGQTDSHGVTTFKENIEARAAAQNMHLYSLSTGTWKKIQSSSDAPCGFELKASNIDDKKVLVLSGQSYPGSVMKENTLHILSLSSEGSLKWSKVLVNMASIPPPTSCFRASTWVPSAKSLFLYGGRYLKANITDAVLKAGVTGEDISVEQVYDTELYCFNLELKQWIRFRVVTGTRPRHSHTMNFINGRIVITGGSRFLFEGKEFATDVISYVLNPTALPPSKNTSTKNNLKKGGRKGKKKR